MACFEGLGARFEKRIPARNPCLEIALQFTCGLFTESCLVPFALPPPSEGPFARIKAKSFNDNFIYHFQFIPGHWNIQFFAFGKDGL